VQTGLAAAGVKRRAGKGVVTTVGEGVKAVLVRLVAAKRWGWKGEGGREGTYRRRGGAPSEKLIESSVGLTTVQKVDAEGDGFQERGVLTSGENCSVGLARRRGAVKTGPRLSRRKIALKRKTNKIRR